MNAESGVFAPNKGTSISKKEAYDADLHANNLTNWQQEYDQTSRGSFYGSIVELPFTDLQVFREHTSQALQQKCVVWPDSVWLGIPLDNQAESRINGLTVSTDQIMCRPGDCNFELTTPENYSLYGMVVHHKTLSRIASIHKVDLNWKELTECGRLAVPNRTLKDVRFILARLLNDDKQIEHRPANRISHDISMMALLEILKLESPQPSRRQSYKHRKMVVDSVRALIDANPNTVFTVTDLCECQSSYLAI